MMTSGVRKTTLCVIILFALCGLVAFSANGYKFTVPKEDPFQPPQGYGLVQTIDLSRGGYAQSAVHTFTIDKPTAVGIYLLVENINSDYIDVRLTGPDQPSDHSRRRLYRTQG
jgi:hypothetical protein